MAPAGVRRVPALPVERSRLRRGGGLIPTNPADRARRPSLPVHDITPPEPDQVRAIIAASAAVNDRRPLFYR